MSKRRYHNRGRGLLALSSAVAIALLLWNWRLWVATSGGIGTMLLVYWLQQPGWQKHYVELQKLLKGFNQQLVLAVGCGGIATVGTYMAVSIWLDSQSHWVATGEILQGLGTSAVLIILIWQWLNRQTQNRTLSFEQSLEELSETDPVRRLIAVRRLSRSLTDVKCDRHTRRTILDAFRLMLDREAEPLVRNAILEGLQLLTPPSQTPPNPQPVSIPLNLQSSPVRKSIHS